MGVGSDVPSHVKEEMHMQEINEGVSALVGQLVETSLPAEVDLIDRKLAILKKHS